MSTSVERTEAALDRALTELADVPGTSTPPAPAGPGPATARSLYRAMLASRALDVAARQLQARGRGHYTISSAGHEYTAVVGHQLGRTDPAFLHYRSGAFVAARRRDELDGFVRDTVAALQASTTDPVAAGRHKVWGSRAAWIPPQTSTIASHLPKAVGTAIALGRVATGRLPRTDRSAELADRSLVCASFGDASLNHATASSGLTMARWARRQGAPVPILFVCEDNGLGISVPTPRRWVEQTLSSLPGIDYVRADGDLAARWSAVARAVDRVRSERTPVALHLPTVRLWGHAGSDVEIGYRDREEVVAAEARDPLVEVARWLVHTGTVAADDLRADRSAVRELVADAVATVEVRHAASAAEVIGPVAVPRGPAAATRGPGSGRQGAGDAARPRRRTLGGRLNQALHELLAERPDAVVFGQDVGRKGGVHGITAGLQERHGTARVFDTLLDETAILGAAQGFGLLGLLPVPEVQYLAYLHNALDQLRGEACTTSWLSDGAFTTPMVLRTAAFAHPGGFGGHFHNDNAIGALRDIPGLLLAAPSRGDDAVRTFRGAARLAADQGRVVGFLEPTALYHVRDLFTDGDDGWLTDAPPDGALWPGDVGVYPAGRHGVGRTRDGEGVAAPPVLDRTAGDAAHPDDGADLLVVTYANGVPMALRVARRLLGEDDVRARVMDLRWLQPLPLPVVAEHARRVGRVLVVDECRAGGGGVADALVAGLVEHDCPAAVATVRARDSYVPLGPAARHVLVGEEDVLGAARRLARAPARR